MIPIGTRVKILEPKHPQDDPVTTGIVRGVNPRTGRLAVEFDDFDGHCCFLERNYLVPSGRGWWVPEDRLLVVGETLQVGDRIRAQGYMVHSSLHGRWIYGTITHVLPMGHFGVALEGVPTEHTHGGSEGHPFPEGNGWWFMPGNIERGSPSLRDRVNTLWDGALTP